MTPTLLLLAACGGLPEQIEDCSDAQCRSDWLLARYQKEPEVAARAVDGIEDPIERVAAVTRVVEAYPGRSRELCDKLVPGPSQSWCRRLNERPHLITEPQPIAPTSRHAGGPSSADLPVPDASTSPLHGAKPEPSPCDNRGDKHVCYANLASRLVAESPLRAAGACAGITETKWSEECMFSAAETLVLARGPQGLADAYDLCTIAGTFGPNCLAHLEILLAQQAPDSAVQDAAGWAQVQAAADEIGRSWAQRDPAYVEIYLDRFWSEALSYAYAESAVVMGTPLDSVPERAQRHVRAAASLRMMELGGPGRYGGLNGWLDALETALALRSQRPPTGGALPLSASPLYERAGDARRGMEIQPNKTLFQGKTQLWKEDHPGDEQVPSTFYWGTGRRTWSADPRQDETICLLEAAAQTALSTKAQNDGAGFTAARRLLDEGARSTEGPIRWTANRLLEAISR